MYTVFKQAADGEFVEVASRDEVENWTRTTRTALPKADGASSQNHPKSPVTPPFKPAVSANCTR